MNAPTSRRSFLTSAIGAGLGAVTEPATNQRLDLDWAEFRLAELRVAHADGADTLAAFAYALIAATEGSKDAASQSLYALERAHTSAERAQSTTMVCWVETGGWATVVGLSRGLIGEPVRPMLEGGLAVAGSARARGGWLVALAEEDLRDHEYASAGEHGLAAVKVLSPAGAVRDLRRLGGVVRGLLACDPADEQARMLGGLLLEYRS